VRVFERTTALPRAYTVRETITVPSIEAALRHVTADSFRPHVEAVVLAAGAGGAPLAREAMDGGPAGAAPETDRAEIIRYETEEVAIRAECGARCLLVLTDLDYPGWHAYVDGARTDIRQINALFRGVYFDPGSHEVVFRYQPTSFRVGVWMFVVTLVSAGLVARAGAH
jgi:hypothetical protein